ncbi:hypothetical protein TPACW86_0799 [Treponema pallidum subsp. pallidum]|uniref:Uncharacterized protein TP_0799 n=2 Tax=Treponema pallidum subsp. pallidum TaxID=161 RepID=Y799_TREPA|nr:RecName: Full=Uncharacterized protein TP_0799 [Treponema pallidum subsp. pallidum str. Nichols]ACD71217.1 hypothetical protein TPASS_0799 [Treponema pallidum subsp. pallidum SS14]ADD72892.1 conserved hypothetical protein [Treponema pallidum subsp. pallidum str. Chicago]AFU66781.1 hypothetical protein TPAMA_0799 [Treponema pallidum subsp. pallidum str. Mexico A]AVW88802.1 hypothetical protein TPAUZ1974_0799 [Treponema pallidum subsp. pallidum]AAC65768.1 predicted coding region TP0799 [Trepon
MKTGFWQQVLPKRAGRRKEHPVQYMPHKKEENATGLMNPSLHTSHSAILK